MRHELVHGGVEEASVVDTLGRGEGEAVQQGHDLVGPTQRGECLDLLEGNEPAGREELLVQLDGLELQLVQPLHVPGLGQKRPVAVGRFPV